MTPDNRADPVVKTYEKQHPEVAAAATRKLKQDPDPMRIVETFHHSVGMVQKLRRKKSCHYIIIKTLM